MMTDKYKEAVVHELGKANTVYEVEQIINRSIGQTGEDDLYMYLTVIYLRVLQYDLDHRSVENADVLKRKNIRHALDYLKQMDEDRKKQPNKPSSHIHD